MERVSEEERARFHKYVDEAVDKMNSPKNSKKKHWNLLSIEYLQKMHMVEAHELDLAVFNFNRTANDIESECFDNINIPLMMIDNLRR